VNHSKNWFECTPCHHDNETSTEFPSDVTEFPGDVVSSEEIPVHKSPVAEADSKQMSSNVGRTFVYSLNAVASNDSVGR